MLYFWNQEKLFSAFVASITTKNDVNIAAFDFVSGLLKQDCYKYKQICNYIFRILSPTDLSACLLFMPFKNALPSNYFWYINHKQSKHICARP